MSAYENVVGGKLKLKGKALDVKAGGVKKKKKTNRQLSDQITKKIDDENVDDIGGGTITTTDQEDTNDGDKHLGESNRSSYLDSMTPAERRYMEQRQQIDMHKMAKTSNKSHRDRISDFNQYLANMSEHYDIPKVGPG
ncbi:protein FAM32A-like [Cynara cardunculus var. scolymus]|uniref:Protein FAM32A n=1 Tax=Cynara cardunculus var. scolymus TaxID=59895 RepID=A0A103XK56_CYNCS|nr:protein FAM32A-like [Cynara cardunculus var. scolymus]XP_024977899.1 protein FAM32A-like [Cynara cardunculus var. scolymus]KVH92179.1 hypothetical protein Ccrd_005790 [Cynara cardunculus var. scolymus]